MLLLRWVRLILLGVPAVVALGLGMTGPALLLLAATAPGYRVAGALLAVGPAALVVWSPALVRTVVVALGGRVVPAAPDEVARLADAARATGQPPPTVLVAAADLPEPVPFRGLRHDLLVVSPAQVEQPQVTAAALAVARRRGDDRLVLVLGALVIVLGSWSSALRLVTTAVRPGRVPGADRLALAGLLPLAPVAALGWGICWVALQVARGVLPRRLTVALLALGGSTTLVRARPTEDLVALGDGVRLGTMLATGRVERRPARERSGARTWWSTPQALAGAASADLLGGAARVVVAVLVVGVGTYAGLGRVPAERIAWPWEAAPEVATAVGVDATRDDGSRSLVERLGADVGTTYTAAVRLPDGRTVDLAPGSHPLAVGDEVRVVPDAEAGGRARSLTQSSAADLIIASGVMLALGAGLLRGVGGLSMLADQRRLAQADHDQRVATGRRHGRRRPRRFLGARG